LDGLVAVDRLARVVASVADHREAVVSPLLDRVDLVAASRTVLARPQLSGARMNRHSLHVSEAERVDLGVRAGALRTELDYFLTCVLENKRPTVISPEESLRAVEACLAAEESAARDGGGVSHDPSSGASECRNTIEHEPFWVTP
jgi:hypothetical protein